MGLPEVLAQQKIFLVGGPGGVGKTTLAAALAVQLAEAGHRTVVLTVDPARRLAQALGFEDFKTDLQEVKIAGIGKGSLHASMLDTQHYFDKIIARFATRPEQRDRILNNPVYRAMVDGMGGTHEYAAMERLLEFANDPRFDRVVVDTPPAQNAIELFNAPQRLADFMDNSVLRWFQGPKPVYLQLFRSGTKLAMKLIRTVFGAEFLDTFAKFMDDLEGMQAGFRNRNLEVIQLLQSGQTAFLLVTYPSEVRYVESIAFLKSLEENRIALTALLLNRVEPECPEFSEFASLAQCENETQRHGLKGLVDYSHALFAQQRNWVTKFREAMPKVPTFIIEKQGEAPTDVDTLSELLPANPVKIAE